MFIDFKEISKIPFKDVLDWLNVPYKEKKTELRGEGFIINKAKNLYFNPKGDDKGSCINFYANLKGLSLRDSAIELKKAFMDEPKPIKREIPDLTLTYGKQVEKLGIDQATAENFEIGIPQGKTIMAGKVAFRCHDKDGKPVGYVGLKDDKWFYPKGFKASEHLYNFNRRNGNQFCILAPSPVEVAKLFQKGKPQAVGMFSQSLSDAQLELLKAFKYVYVIHPNPENIVLRLSKHCYTKHSVDGEGL